MTAAPRRDAPVLSLVAHDAGSLADGLRQGAPDAGQRPAVARLLAVTLPVLLLCLGLVGAWIAWAPLAGAVRAPGVVKPEFDRRSLQHHEGGIVRAVRVQEGQAVLQGERLLAVGDRRLEAALAQTWAQLADADARIARAETELRLAPALAPLAASAGPGDDEAAADADVHDIAPDVAALRREARQREQLLFEARRRTMDEQQAALERQIGQLRRSAEALGAQAAHAQNAVSLAGQELQIHERLAADGFVSPLRVVALQRQLLDTRTRVEASQGQAADARARIAALQQAQAETRGQYQQRAADEHRGAQARRLELRQQLRPLLDQAERQWLRAPVDGRVLQLRAKTPGGSVAPREPLLDLVPSEERLIVELRIAPEDIDHVRPGAAAQLHVSAFDHRHGAPLAGHVTAVSADAVGARDAAGASAPPAFSAQVEIDRDTLPEGPEWPEGPDRPGRPTQPALRLQAGMAVDAYIATAPRSVWDYLIAPVSGFARRAMREP